MATISLFPKFMDPLASVGAGIFQTLSDGLQVEVQEVPDVEIEAEIVVEVASTDIDVELDQEIVIEVQC